MACVALLSLMRTLELEFLQPQPRPILQEMELLTPFNKDLIQSLLKKLGFLMELFDMKRMDIGVEAIKELETKLRDVAFRVEDEIEFQIAHLHETEEDEFGIGTPQGDTDAQKSSTPSFKLGLILQQGMEDIDAVKEELVKFKNEYMLQATLDVLPISVADSSRPASESNSKMIGRDNKFEIIKKMLIKDPSEQLQIVSISGMGGIGKTMLARRIYEDESIASHFEVRAWVVASQHHNNRQMLLALLNSLGYTNNSNSISDQDLSQQLCLALGTRYLLVIDDVWSMEECDAILGCILDYEMDGRVLLTTRFTKMIYNSRYINYFFRPMQMQPLNQRQSWKLFCIKARSTKFETIGKQCWNLCCIKAHSTEFEFETIGKPIVEKCKGVPFAIVMVASLFSKLNKLSELENIAQTLYLSAMTTIVEAWSRIFSLDYNRLPYNFQACFLYLGVFPEGKVIYVKDLARLWASEGLIIKEFGQQSLDEVAERCVQELLDRNLIFERKRSYCGRKIKAFEMHGLQHAFCVRQAQKENLLHVVAGNGFNFCLKGFPRWLSIQSTDFDEDTRTLLHSASSSITCRSIFCFSEAKSLHLKSFNLLRVFYFTDASMCKKIVDLVHLRYLPQVVRDFRIIKLLKAWNLQTLDVYADDGRNNLNKFRQQHDSQNRPSKLKLKPRDCTIDFFLRSPYLEEVVITGERSSCNDCIDTLVYLLQLRGLHINGNVWDSTTPQAISINNQIGRLKGLVELSFQNMNFEWKGIDVLCMLPRLEVLRLLSSSIGKVWELSMKDVFQRLIYLEIFSTDLKHWKASAINFLNLERLLLRNCFRLREIPDSFADIWSLKSIELTRCLTSAVNSAKQIQAQLDEYKLDMVVIEKETIQLSSDEVETTDGDESNEDEFGQQQDSQSPSKLKLKPRDCTIDFFLRSPYLEEVVITGERRSCNECIDNLVFLPQLRGLHINGKVWDSTTPQRISINNQIAGLKGLVELSFRNMNFEWEGINILCQLPKLKVLRLLFSSIGKEWILSEGEFQSLIYFEIFSTDLKHWRATCDHFPQLEHLLLRNCFRLRGIPEDFGEICTLKSIELTRCLPSAVYSAKKIQAEQQDYGNEDMLLIEKETILPKDWI